MLERFLSTEGDTGRTRALWDDLGNLAGYLDDGGYRKQQAYDLLGRVREVDDPNAGHVLFEYDAASNLVSSTDARGKTARTEYDGANRPVARFNPDDAEATRVRMQYDFVPDCDECTHAEGQLARVDYPLEEGVEHGRDEYGFDVRGRGVFFGRALEGHRFVVATEFDNAGRVVHQRFPDGTTLRHRYDAASRLVGVKGILQQVEYDARGELQALHYNNGFHTVRAYDARLRLAELQTFGKNHEVVQSLRYRHDRVGNVVGVIDQANKLQGGVDHSAQYQLDAWYRVLQTDLSQGAEILQMEFDRLDNMTRKVSSLGAASAAHVGDLGYHAGRPNALSETGDVEFGYDEAGHLEQRAGTSLVWDDQGRLQEAGDGQGAQARYLYGPGIERVIERHRDGVTYYVGPDFEVRDGIAVTYARLGRQRVGRLSTAALGPSLLSDLNASQHVDVGDAFLAQKLGLAELSALLRGSARRLLLEAEGEKVLLHGDHLQSLTLASLETGQMRGQRAYYPTGQVRQSEGYVDRYGFTGQRTDPTTGFLHFAFRELDAAHGRWATPDPLFLVSEEDALPRFGESTTAYAYVAGRFSSAADPLGLAGEGVLPERGWMPVVSRSMQGYDEIFSPEYVIGDSLSKGATGGVEGSVFYRFRRDGYDHVGRVNLTYGPKSDPAQPWNHAWHQLYRNEGRRKPASHYTIGNETVLAKGRNLARQGLSSEEKDALLLRGYEYSEKSVERLQRPDGRVYEHTSRSTFKPATTLKSRLLLHALAMQGRR